MKTTISSDLTLYFSHLFPYRSWKTSSKHNYVVLGVGGNLGNTKRVFQKLFLMLKGDGRFHILSSSPLLKNPPFGFLEQNDFLNGVIMLQTDLSPRELLTTMQRYEKRFKRVRSFKDAPRTLDIDIIFFNTLKLKTKNLIIPHPHYHERQSVTIPLQFVLSV
jgi:2-amino-4-hydroxy-6-hydroxymethyldihydropteridine diphosphokinase